MTPDNIAAVFTAAISASEEFTSPQGVTKTLWEAHPDGVSIPGKSIFTVSFLCIVFSSGRHKS